MEKHQFDIEFHQTLEKRDKLKKRMNMISIFRFLFMFICLGCLLWGYFGKYSFLYLFSGISLVVFLWFVQYHDDLKKQYQYYQAKSDIYQQHIDRIQYKWSSFSCDGSQWCDDHNYKVYDLDILGQHSLFQMINVAFTDQGQKNLAMMLCQEPSSYQEVIKHQNAVRDLSQHKEFMIEVQTYGQILPRHSGKTIDEYIAMQNQFQKMPNYIFIVSFLTVMAAIGTLFSIANPYSRVIFEIGAVSQLCFSLFYFSKHQRLFEPIQKLEKSLSCFQDIFNLIEKEHFQSEELLAIQAKICRDGHAVQGISSLSKIASRVNYRQNIFAYVVLNALGMFDFIVRNQYVQWSSLYQKNMKQWFEGLYQLESYMSLCVLYVDGFNVHMPEISQSQKLVFHQIKHPLIENAVGNDFEMEKTVCIITGSNMSGKTTFMRTIGLNLVLAYAGGYVFAESMECSLMHMMTSMRVKDNVEEGISTFYGELLRIKEMITYAQNQAPMICLIDEIFKGTNSLDRLAGAKATLQKLSLPFMMTFLTTHDVELCYQIQSDIVNYHFDEYYQDSHIYFDYQIKKGISQTTNGQFLLKQLGILEEDDYLSS